MSRTGYDARGWYGLVWFCFVWYGLDCLFSLGLVRSSLVWCGVALSCLVLPLPCLALSCIPSSRFASPRLETNITQHPPPTRTSTFLRGKTKNKKMQNLRAKTGDRFHPQGGAAKAGKVEEERDLRPRLDPRPGARARCPAPPHSAPPPARTPPTRSGAR